jgi:hypothetical protein
MTTPSALVPSKVVQLSDWPAGDRAAWDIACRHVRGPFRKDGGGRRLAMGVVLACRTADGRWLAFLVGTNQLDEPRRQSARVTPARLDAFIAAMRECGNQAITILGRIYALKSALQMLEPTGDHRWITRPQGVPIKHCLSSELRVRPVITAPTCSSGLHLGHARAEARRSRPVAARAQPAAPPGGLVPRPERWHHQDG